MAKRPATPTGQPKPAADPALAAILAGIAEGDPAALLHDMADELRTRLAHEVLLTGAFRTELGHLAEALGALSARLRPATGRL